jgi:hypothetical protein
MANVQTLKTAMLAAVNADREGDFPRAVDLYLGEGHPTTTLTDWLGAVQRNATRARRSAGRHDQGEEGEHGPQVQGQY